MSDFVLTRCEFAGHVLNGKGPAGAINIGVFVQSPEFPNLIYGHRKISGCRLHPLLFGSWARFEDMADMIEPVKLFVVKNPNFFVVGDKFVLSLSSAVRDESLCDYFQPAHCKSSGFQA